MNFDNPDLLVVIGSKLYGCSTPDSDTDYRGVIIPDTEYILGLAEFNLYESPTEDKVIYSLKNFFRQLQRGNTQFLEVLFSNQIIQCNWIGHEILNNRYMFVGKHFSRSIMGFAHSEWRKVIATNYILKPERKSEETILEELFGKFNVTSFNRDAIINILYQEKENPRVALNNTRKLGESRKKLIDTYGMDTKSASHALRLLGQGIELLQTGQIKFPLIDATYLLDVKLGKYTLDQVTKEYQDRITKLDDVYKNCKLPEKARIKEINNLYIKLVKDKYWM
jgi:predicted nucleotidyltransferase